MRDPVVGGVYETDIGLLYYVLATHEEGSKLRTTFLVLDDSQVEPQKRHHLLAVGEISEHVGPRNFKWLDRRVAL